MIYETYQRNEPNLSAHACASLAEQNERKRETVIKLVIHDILTESNLNRGLSTVKLQVDIVC
jgi:hypothetical protein